MRASELIKELQAMVEKHGDHVVRTESSDGEYDGDREINEVQAYDINGNTKGEIVEIYLHG